MSKVQEVIEIVKNLAVLELSELVKALEEEEIGVSCPAAPCCSSSSSSSRRSSS